MKMDAGKRKNAYDRLFYWATSSRIFDMIAITGARGFLGSYIADKLPFPQKRLTRSSDICPDPSEQYSWIQGDLHNIDDIKKLTHNTPILIHLACTTNPRTSNHNLVQDIEQNLISSLQLFEIFASANPGGHIIFSSTGGDMYDASIQGVVRHETDIPLPRSSYSIHKLTIEHYLRQFCENKKISATILRISNPYGILQSTKRTQGLIGVAFAKLLAKEELPILDSLDTVRDYVHLDDVVQAFRLVITHLPLYGECRLFNVSSGCGFTNASVLDLIDNTTHLKIKRHFPSYTFPSPTWSVLSYAKIKQALGWQPTINLPEGIKGIWENILNTQPPLHSYAT
jgi:UDP-glucose 4-epimerase